MSPVPTAPTTRTCGVDSACGRLLHILEELALGSTGITKQQHVDVTTQPVGMVGGCAGSEWCGVVCVVMKCLGVCLCVYAYVCTGVRGGGGEHAWLASGTVSECCHCTQQSSSILDVSLLCAVAWVLLHTAKERERECHLDVLVAID